MKLLSKILGISTLGLVISLPLVSRTPVWAEFAQVKEAIAQAAPEATVQLNLSAARKSTVVTTDGEETIAWENLDGGATVMPGDTLRYTVSSQNTGADSARNLTITQPVPEQMVYRLDTASSANQTQVTYSINGGETFESEPKIKVKNADGQMVERPAPPETYTHIRWQFETLGAEAEIAAMYEVEVQ